jgi:hypothetical protein
MPTPNQNMTVLPTSSLPPSTLHHLTECYTSYHPDSRRWLPDSPDGAHTSVWARMDVDDVYYVGGFGE